MNQYPILLLFFATLSNATAQWSLILDSANMHRVTARDSTILVASSTGSAWLSKDRGNTWTDISAGLPGTSIRSLAIGADSTLFCTAGSGIHRKLGQGNWQQVYAGGNFLCILAKGDTIVAGAELSGRVRVSLDNGTTWADLPNSPQYVTDLEWWGNELVASAFNVGVRSSTDLGASWSAFATNSAAPVFALAGTDTHMLGGISSGVQSSNGSSIWTPIFNTSTAVYRMEAEQNYVLASPRYFSSDNGMTWQEELPSGEYSFLDVDISEGIGYAICAGQRLYKFDIGVWQAINSFTSASDLSIFFDPGSNTLTIISEDGPPPLQIIDPRGRVVSTLELGQGRTSIPLIGLASGIYLARVGRRTLRFQLSW